MISTFDGLFADSVSTFQRSLDTLRSSEGITPEFILEVESQSLSVFKSTALVARSSDNLDEIARHWWQIYEFYHLMYQALEAFKRYQPDTEHLERVSGLLDQLRKRARRLHDMHA
jgi:hypothetical protein